MNLSPNELPIATPYFNRALLRRVEFFLCFLIYVTSSPSLFIWDILFIYIYIYIIWKNDWINKPKQQMIGSWFDFKSLQPFSVVLKLIVLSSLINFSELIGIVTSHWPCVDTAAVTILCLFCSPYHSFDEETNQIYQIFSSQ